VSVCYSQILKSGGLGKPKPSAQEIFSSSHLDSFTEEDIRILYQLKKANTDRYRHTTPLTKQHVHDALWIQLIKTKRCILEGSRTPLTLVEQAIDTQATWETQETGEWQLHLAHNKAAIHTLFLDSPWIITDTF